MAVRMIYVFHVTWFVNSATHMWGYRNYETTDDSRNLWWVGLLAFGEGWHNNHHADPASASMQVRWWEFDLNYQVIRLLARLGIVTQVVPPRHVRERLRAEAVRKLRPAAVTEMPTSKAA